MFRLWGSTLTERQWRSARTIRTWAIGVAITLGSLGRISAEDLSPADLEFFEQHVRPVLVNRCYKCHSAEAKELQAGLMLDSRAGVLKGGDLGPAAVPGDPANSLLIKAIGYDDSALAMPPDTRLASDEIASLTEWVRRGLPDPRQAVAQGEVKTKTIDIEAGRKHWAFLPLAEVTPPTLDNDDWSRTPIDRFILAELRRRGIEPTPAASPLTLLRRAWFDIAGLPPPPTAVTEFSSEIDDRQYDVLIDQLLANPAFGERWARHWLDLARFAESHGFEHDYDRPNAYHYRDFVIRAFNDDLPFNTFTQWQIAGDEVAPDSSLALMATGFLAAGVHSTQITKSQVEKERYDELDDMAATVGTAFLGLTLGCARCHDHKFDPLPVDDYYRMVSVFTTTVRSEVELDLEPEKNRLAKAEFDAAHKLLTDELTTYERQSLPAQLEAYLAHRPAEPPLANWWALAAGGSSKSGAAFAVQPEASVQPSDPAAEHEEYTLTAETNLSGITALRLEALADAALPKHGPGRAANGNFALSDLSIAVAHRQADGSYGEPQPLKLARATATFEQPSLPVAAAIDGDPMSAWAVDGQIGRDHAAAFELAEPLDAKGGVRLTIRMRFDVNQQHAIGRLRLALAAASPPPAPYGLAQPQAQAELYAMVSRISGAPTPEMRMALMHWLRKTDAGWLTRDEKVRQHAAQTPKPVLTKVLVSTEGLPAVRLHSQGDDYFPQTYHLRRGDPSQKQGVAEPGYLQVLMRGDATPNHWQQPPPEGWRTSYRRTALANWMTDVDQGAGNLLARVIVNRLWQHHLGRGLVATPSDFGTQGAKPTHPELLDWLAGELIRGGWRLKPIHRLIMQSAVYRQATADDAERHAIDPQNETFWQRPRARLEAEVIRDALLAVGGQLDPAMFGPGTLDQSSRRRSIYFTVKRSQMIPMLMLFDEPDALSGMAIRSSTTVAPQALALLNHPLVRQSARGLAELADRGQAEGWNSSVEAIYLRALARRPTDGELADATAFLDHQQASYAPVEGQPAPRVRALADFCQVLFCLNEFVYVD